MFFLVCQWLLQQMVVLLLFYQVSEQVQNVLLYQQIINFSGGDGYQVLNMQGSGVFGVLCNGYIGGSWNYSCQVCQGVDMYDCFYLDDFYYCYDLVQCYYLQLGCMDWCNLFSQQGGIFSFGMLLLDCFEGLCVGIIQVYVDVDVSIVFILLIVLFGCDVCVDVFDGDCLLQIFYFQVGVNDLDICCFFVGIYIVILWIYEDGCFVCSEEVLFSCGGDWFDCSVQWFVQGGWWWVYSVCECDVVFLDIVLQVGLCVLFMCNYGMMFGVVCVVDIGYGEFCLEGCQWLGDYDLQVMVSVISGGDGSYGMQQQLSYCYVVLWNFYCQCLCGGVCGGSILLQCDCFGCIDLFSVLVLIFLFGGSLYLGYM